MLLAIVAACPHQLHPVPCISAESTLRQGSAHPRRCDGRGQLDEFARIATAPSLASTHRATSDQSLIQVKFTAPAVFTPCAILTALLQQLELSDYSRLLPVHMLPSACHAVTKSAPCLKRGRQGKYFSGISDRKCSESREGNTLWVARGAGWSVLQPFLSEAANCGLPVLHRTSLGAYFEHPNC